MVTDIKSFKTICPKCEHVQAKSGQEIDGDTCELLCVCEKCGNRYDVELDDYRLCDNCNIWVADWDCTTDGYVCFTCQDKLGIKNINVN